ncbi:MAG: hypothetical protein ACE5HT_07395 [Gemmatimonadales bacterium]
MTCTVRVFVDERPVAVSPGSSVFDVVTMDDAELASAISRGTAYVTDGVGRRLDPSTPVKLGDILRVVRSARSSSDEKD